MKAFWWFKENSIAGMARPGFNATHFYDLNFNDMTVLGWLGRYSCGVIKLQDFHTHIQIYMPRVFSLIKMEPAEGEQKLRPLLSMDGLRSAIAELNQKTQILEHFEFNANTLNLKLNFKRLDTEIAFLKNSGINSVVALTEDHHQRDLLANHFDVHHISIPDMHPPSLEQAMRLAKIIEEARSKDKKVAVHCLAGIGRTSTMIVAAQVLLGEKLADMKVAIAQRNPSFKLHGSQAEFLDSLETT